MGDELAIWEPSEFEGTDLLPMQKHQTLSGLAEGEELVGDENIDQEDLVLPVLSLLHGTSNAITRGVEGARVGKFHLSVSDEIFEPPLRLIVVHHSKSKALFPKDNDERYREHPMTGEPVQKCVARNGLIGDTYGDCEDCGLYRWRSKTPGEKPPLCAESHNFVVWIHGGPAILRCSRSNFGAGKRFVSEKKMSSVNWWHHPLIVRVGQGQTTLGSGKIQTYPTIELHWARRDTVPIPIRQQMRMHYDTIQAAHELGRMRGEHEDDLDPVM